MILKANWKHQLNLQNFLKNFLLVYLSLQLIINALNF